MVLELSLIALLTFVAAGIGTLTGFGTSTIMIPVILLFLPLAPTLLFVGIIHLVGNIWKIILFKSGIRWRLIILFGGAGIIGSFIGAKVTLAIPEEILLRSLGIFLLLYVIFLFRNPKWKLTEKNYAAISGGLMSGLVAGLFGVGGAIRSAFLTVYNLKKEVFIFTAAIIALFTDATRITTYIYQGTQLSTNLWWGMLIFIPASFAGAWTAKKVVNKIPQEKFRFVVTVFLAIMAIKFLISP